MLLLARSWGFCLMVDQLTSPLDVCSLPRRFAPLILLLLLPDFHLVSCWEIMFREDGSAHGCTHKKMRAHFQIVSPEADVALSFADRCG